jgi:hypothetical protein
VNFQQKQNKKLFADIVNGYSELIEPIDKKKCYIKHFNELDFAVFENKKIDFYEKAVKEKLPTEAQQEEYIFQEKLWSKELDLEIANKIAYLENIKKAKGKLFLMSQIEQLNIEIAKLETEIFLQKKQREELIGYTAEKYADNRMNIIHISNSIYKDKDLKETLFTEEDLEEFDDKNFYEYILSYNKIMSLFKEDNIKSLGLDYTIQTMIGLSGENLFGFYGKALVYLTKFQSLLLLYGKYFRNIIMSEEYSKVPEDIKNNADKLMDWFTASKNLKERASKNNKNSGASFIMGATEKDMEAIDGGKENRTDLNSMAKQKGGTLGVDELAKFYKR